MPAFRIRSSNGGLRRLIHRQGNVLKRRLRHLRPELGLIGRIGELEERHRAAIADPIEGVHIGAHLAEELI